MSWHAWRLRLLLLLISIGAPAFAACPPQTVASVTSPECHVPAVSFSFRQDSGSAPVRDFSERELPREIVLDEKWFWTKPAHLQKKDVEWLVPFGAITAGLVAADNHIEGALPDSPGVINHTRQFSNVAVGAMAGAAGGLYLWGKWRSDSHARETGLLSAEALAGSFVVAEAVKLVAQRERPPEHDHDGSFWQGGSSFPSGHSVAAWSVAEVIAEEYPRPATRVLAYGMATAISATRITGRRHFSSDVFIGGALGWYFGRHVFRTHHQQPDQRFGRFVHSLPQ